MTAKSQPNSTGSARVRIEALEAFIAAALRTVGVAEQPARTTAKVLALTDSWGTFTHGVKGLRGYLMRLRDGGLIAGAVPRVADQGPAWALIDAGSCIGMVSSVAAMELAIDKAKTAGIAYVGVRNACHFGAAGAYAVMAAERGMIGLAMANDTPSMAGPGAKGRVIGNNPFAFAAPSGNGMVMLDMALSTVAGGKLMAAHYLGKPIPADWSIDRDGNPTTDPGDFLAGGALTTAGGFKGFGLAVMVEAIAAALTGANMGSAVKPWMVKTAEATGHGHAFIAIDAGKMAPGAFAARMGGLADEIRGAPAKPGETLMMPGDPEFRRRATALRDGIELPADVVAAIRDMARETGVDIGRLFES